MPVYDPRNLIEQLKRERAENIKLTKRVSKLIIEYANLLKEYDKLHDAFLIDKQTQT
mgnify:CR=1 FL=1